MLKCVTFQNKTRCFLARMTNITPRFDSLSDSEKVSTILCPVSAVAAKTANKYMQLVCRARNAIDSGEHVSSITFPPQVNTYTGVDNNLSLSSSVSLDLNSTLETLDESFLLSSSGSDSEVEA